MKYAHRQLFPSTQPRLSPYTFAPSPFSPRPTIAHRDFSSEHSPRRVHPISFLPPSPPPSKRNRSWTQHHVKNIDWPDYIVYPGIIEFARKYLHLLEGGKSFSLPFPAWKSTHLPRPRPPRSIHSLTNREEKRAVSVPRFETTWPRMGWNLWRRRSRTRI